MQRNLLQNLECPRPKIEDHVAAFSVLEFDSLSPDLRLRISPFLDDLSSAPQACCNPAVGCRIVVKTINHRAWSGQGTMLTCTPGPRVDFVITTDLFATVYDMTP